MDFQTFEDVQDHLDRLGLFHMDFELDRMIRALSALDLLEHAPFIAAQVVGTNGKGSTSTFLASLAHAHGLKTGLYTSPHFVTPRERIRINGQMLDAALWPGLATRIMQVAPDLTYFEFLTALALLAFADAGVELVVLEAGLGGQYDATTAMPVQAVCFTPISMDHEAILGPTLTAIASDKGQAMRPGVPAFTAPQAPEALHALRQIAAEKGVVLHELPALPSAVNAPENSPARANSESMPLPPLGLAGPHQQINAHLALRVWDALASTFGWPCKPEAIREGLAAARLAGRLQSVPSLPCIGSDGRTLPPLLLDGAHNPHGLHALEQALKAEAREPCAVIFSCLADKNMDEMLPILCRLAKDAPILVPTIQDNERAMLGTILAKRIQTLRGAPADNAGQKRTLPVQRLSLALQDVAALTPTATQDRPVLLCGSLYLLGEFFTLYPQVLECSGNPLSTAHASTIMDSTRKDR